MLLFGLVGLIFFGFITLITLNYSIYLWENQRIENLASQIKKEKLDETMINNSRKSSFIRKGAMNSSSKAIEIFNKNDRQLATIEGDQNILSFNWTGFLNFFKQAWNFLLQLASPPKTDVYDPVERAKLQDIEDTLSEMSQEVEDDYQDFSQGETMAEDQASNSFTSQKPQTAKIKKTKPFQFASVKPDPTEETDEYLDNNIQYNNTETEQGEQEVDNGPALNYLAQEDLEDEDNIQQKRKKSLFKKLENKILKKLKEVGLNHYDIWLELARLYEKYGKTQEAVKIYAMILKHAQGDPKEFARNKLIALT